MKIIINDKKSIDFNDFTIDSGPLSMVLPTDMVAMFTKCFHLELITPTHKTGGVAHGQWY